MCAFTASGKAGNQVAVVIDANHEFDNQRMARIAERCVESMVAFIQPAQSKAQQRYYCVVNLLSPQGECSRTMAASMVIAAMSVLLEVHRPAALAPLSDGETVLLKLVSPGGKAWQDEAGLRVGEEGALWVKVPTPRMLGSVPADEVCEALNVGALALQTELPLHLARSGAPRAGLLGPLALARPDVPVGDTSGSTLHKCFEGFSTVCVVSQGVCGVWNPKTVTLTPARVQ